MVGIEPAWIRQYPQSGVPQTLRLPPKPGAPAAKRRAPGGGQHVRLGGARRLYAGEVGRDLRASAAAIRSTTAMSSHDATGTMRNQAAGFGRGGPSATTP